jgi:hypothetical protein
VVEEARVPEQPPTIGKQLVNFIIRVYGIKYKIFHEQVLIKSSRNILYFIPYTLMIKFTSCLPMVGGCSGTLASSTTKTGRHDIAEILLNVALNTKVKVKSHVMRL